MINATQPSPLGDRRPPKPSAWDARVDAWEEIATSPTFRSLATTVLELADPGPTDVVVDLGAGTGLLALPAAACAAKVYAVDYSEPMLARVAERAEFAGVGNVRCVHADLRELPLADESATIVVSNYAFHHLPDVGKELALSEARRVLRPGGRLVICDMMFALTLRPEDRAIVASKVAALARKGPAGVFRIAKNVGRIAARRWEHPATTERWIDLLEGRHFTDVTARMSVNEAGIACARRPVAQGTP